MRLAVAISLLQMLLYSCASTEQEKAPEQPAYTTLTGNAQGTTFKITFLDSTGKDHVENVKDILEEIDNSVSTYVDSSVISRFNAADTFTTTDAHFFYNLAMSRQVHHYSEGAFDPTVMPLVRAWGFGPEGKPEADTSLVDSLLPIIGLANIENKPRIQEVQDFEKQPITLWKKYSGVQLDFNAIAQGYTVDVVWKYFRGQGIQDVFVEIGGEVRVSGKNPDGEDWVIAIDKPQQERIDGDHQAVIALHDMALATSGNYRKFYEKGTNRFSHTIDPKTGRPVRHGLLSATVLAKDCASADAFATAFMVIGTDRTKALLTSRPGLGLEVYLVYSENGETKVYRSEGFPPSMLN